jgi:membrane protease YdiL (CAAX protease family)
MGETLTTEREGAPVETSARRLILWMIAVAMVELASQVLRLHQTKPGTWLAIDYASRLVALALLAVDPVLRRVVYCRQPRQIHFLELAGWSAAFIVLHLVRVELSPVLYQHLPSIRLGSYPRPTGLLYLFDMTFGVALVAVHEELFFRRAMRATLGGLGDGRAMVVVSAVPFGLHHWWTGIPNILGNVVFGILAMLLYRRSGAIWPLIVIHYLDDLAWFA